MHLKFCLPYILLATHKKTFLMSEHRRRDPAWFLVSCRENAGSGSGVGDA